MSYFLIRKHIIMYMYLETSQLNSDIVEHPREGGGLDHLNC